TGWRPSRAWSSSAAGSSQQRKGPARAALRVQLPSGLLIAMADHVGIHREVRDLVPKVAVVLEDLIALVELLEFRMAVVQLVVELQGRLVAAGHHLLRKWMQDGAARCEPLQRGRVDGIVLRRNPAIDLECRLRERLFVELR